MADGSFVPTTNIFDTSFIYSVNVNSKDFKELLVITRNTLSEIATVLNTKTTGMHPLEEFITGNTYFPDPTLNSTTPVAPTQRPSVITTVNFGALPNTATKSVPHGIIFPTGTNTFRSISITAGATDLTGKIYIELGYSSPVLANNIEINYDAVNINITTGSDRTNFTECIVVLEYIKS